VNTPSSELAQTKHCKYQSISEDRRGKLPYGSYQELKLTDGRRSLAVSQEPSGHPEKYSV